MKPGIARQLVQLNRDFYDQLAGPFAASRLTPLPGVERLLAYVLDDSALLDVGCGNGRLAVALDRLGRRVRYVGIDASTPLIEHARQAVSPGPCASPAQDRLPTRAGNLQHVSTQFLVRDVTTPNWTDNLPHRPFQTVAMLALLHHIPGADRRISLLREAAKCLAPAGAMLLSTWQFLHSPRLRRRLQPWHLIGLRPEDVEPGDYLLDWQRDGRGLRYCAFIDQTTLGRLAEAAGLRVVETFYAGRDDLNLCAVLRRNV